MEKTKLSVEELGTILGIWAHPDDEVFSSAGLMLRALQNGQRVIVVTATRGDAGKTADESKWPQHELTNIRTHELEQSLRILGVREHYWLDYRDGELNNVNVEEAVSRIIDLLDGTFPDTIVTFEKHGITGHEDHKTVHKWASKISQQFSGQARVICATECREYFESVGRELDRKHDIYFNIDHPHTVGKAECAMCVQLTPEDQALKLQAIAAHASQTSGMLSDEDGKNAVSKLCECECFEIL